MHIFYKNQAQNAHFSTTSTGQSGLPTNSSAVTQMKPFIEITLL